MYVGTVCIKLPMNKELKSSLTSENYGNDKMENWVTTLTAYGALGN